jgi:hypothetical protein
MASARPGAEAVVTRPTDALLAQAIRQCLLEVDRSAGPPGAITDPQIARALRLIRETPGRPWSKRLQLLEVPLGLAPHRGRFQRRTELREAGRPRLRRVMRVAPSAAVAQSSHVPFDS